MLRIDFFFLTKCVCYRRIGLSVAKELQKAKIRTKENHIAAIEATFDSINHVPVHPTKKYLKPVEILPILPDFQLWSNQYVGKKTFSS